jgi:transcriptional regulator with XRE-family HTH domain
MARNERRIDPQIIEAEENLLIDFQFLLEELMMKKGIERAELAARTGISEARLSQLMGAAANPTAKTFARLFHALGEEVTISTKHKRLLAIEEKLPGDWQWGTPAVLPEKLFKKARRDQLVAVVRAAVEANDNYSGVLVWDQGENTATLKVA